MKDRKTSLFLQFEGFLKTPLIKKGSCFLGFQQFLIHNKKIPISFFDSVNLPPKLILGKRMEYFFFLYLEYFSEEKVLAHSRQIISEKITLGELDFLLKNKTTGEISHVELVYKFYLYDPKIEREEERWIGPNRNDSLLKKCNKLKNKQFPLLFRAETEPLLRELNLLGKKIQQKICFKANLFVPLPLLGKTIPCVNNSCLKGFWIPVSAFTASAFGGFEFFSPQKSDWPIAPENGTIWYSFREMEQQLLTPLTHKTSRLVWMKQNENRYSRFFVVWW